MSKRQETLKEEVAPAAKEAIVAEAIEEVWGHMEKALKGLDPESASLLSDFFDGKSVEELAADRQLQPQQVEEWLRVKKTELIRNLRASRRTRQ